MRSYQVTKYEGENMGPIDWAYDFRRHFDCCCVPDKTRDEMCERAKNILREVESLKAAGSRVEVRISDWWHEVYDVGMYDGWPYWRPTPSIYVATSLGGGEWQTFSDLREVRAMKQP